jgi:hypothetical protein
LAKIVETKEDEAKILEDLEKARALTEITGELSPLQKEQLKYWPMLVSEAVEGCETRFNFENRELVFDIKISEKNKTKFEQAKMMLKNLEEWSQGIFGLHYLVKAKFNGKTVFRGTRKEAFSPKTQEEEDFMSFASREYKKNKRFIK